MFGNYNTPKHSTMGESVENDDGISLRKISQYQTDGGDINQEDEQYLEENEQQLEGDEGNVTGDKNVNEVLEDDLRPYTATRDLNDPDYN